MSEMRRALSDSEIVIARLNFGRLSIARAEQNGQQLAVIRPVNPAVALSRAAAALEHQDADAFQRIPQDGEYQYVGFLAHTAGSAGYAVDANGEIVDGLLPGDSFVEARSIHKRVYS